MTQLSLKERFQLSRFFVGEKPTDEAVALNHRRIFILPTLRGLGFSLLLIVLLLIAFVYNNNLVYWLTFLLAGIFFIAILHTYRSLSGLLVEKEQCKPVFLGQAAGFEIKITNPNSMKRHHLLISLDKIESLMINEHSKMPLTLYSTTNKRGWCHVGTITIASSYPLGLFKAWSPIRFNQSVLVYPKPAQSRLPFPQIASPELRQGSNVKGQEDFFGVQEYQAGDPIRQIHWKSYAKGLGLHSKQYSGENSAEVWLDYSYTPGGSIEERLSQMCRWLVDAEKMGIAYGFILPGLKLRPSNGSLHYKKCLEALALF